MVTICSNGHFNDILHNNIWNGHKIKQVKNMTPPLTFQFGCNEDWFERSEKWFEYNESWL